MDLILCGEGDPAQAAYAPELRRTLEEPQRTKASGKPSCGRGWRCVCVWGGVLGLELAHPGCRPY